ncbi:unnamed protein product [Orchesella dallaii]|uniref:Macro domain-containing protein n=1 Tax=Orchesella dallaii TaxID=48710 RepID=A0ABP1PWX6_9HEXA
MEEIQHSSENVRTFEAELLSKGKTVKLEVPIIFPFEETRVHEYTLLVLSSFGLSEVYAVDLESKLQSFVEQENYKVISDIAETDEEAIEQNIKEWEKSFKEETLQFNPPEVVGDDEVFAEAYHSLVHSPMLATLLRKESALNSAIKEMHRLKNSELEGLNERQNQEMTAAISMASQNNTTTDVNTLATIHFDEAHLVQTRWESLIENENAKQKREFRDWVVKTYQDYFLEAEEQQNNTTSSSCTGNKRNKKKYSVRFDETLMISYGDEDIKEPHREDSYLEESFTIHLGSQMKQTYNIRLMSCHPMDFLRFKNESSRELSPQRLQMAISLYSTDLSGVVLLTDQETSIYKGVTRELYELTQQTTEFHFDRLESQLQDGRPAELKPGDFLVTRHSNLNSAHVVFHLVCNQQSLNRLDINSRHPVILGLRNILKTACLYDITTITIPALLAHEMVDIMNPSWCSRRAELVYKCVKGFMIEMSSWGGSDMKNVQFLAPQDISEDVFNNLASMLPNIFRVSNPLRLSTSSSSHSLQHQSSN